MNTVLDKITQLGVVPVVMIDDTTAAAPLGQALIDGGPPCAEITFRTAVAPAVLATMAAQFPSLVLGAGTILSVEQAEMAVKCGARFIVTPGFDDDVVDYCLANDVPIVPGIVTPSELNRALKKGIRTVKFFPAEAAGGVKMLKSLSSPYGDVTFMPTGGVNADNLPDYLAIPAVLACGGSWMVKRTLIADGDFATITRLAREAVTIVQASRGA